MSQLTTGFSGFQASKAKKNISLKKSGMQQISSISQNNIQKSSDKKKKRLLSSQIYNNANSTLNKQQNIKNILINQQKLQIADNQNFASCQPTNVQNSDFQITEGQINMKLKDLENRYQQKKYNSHNQNDFVQQSNTMKEIQMNKFGQNHVIWEPQLNYEREFNSNSAYKQKHMQSVERPSFYQKVDKYKLQQFSPTLNYPQHINQDQENENAFKNFSSNRYSEDLKNYLAKNTINSNSSANIVKKVDQTAGVEMQSDLTDAAQEYGQIKINNLMSQINEVSVINESSKKVIKSEPGNDNIQYQTQANFDKNIFQNSSQIPQRQQNFEKSPDSQNLNRQEKSPISEENQNAQLNLSLDNDAIRKKTYEILNQKAPSKYEAIQNDQNDKIKTELFDLIENFEKIFVNFINSNYRSFTEKQVHQLIHDELKVQIKNMLKKLQPQDMFQKCDPFKIEQILQNIDNLWNSHEQIKNFIHKFGTSVNQLAQSSFKMKEDAFYHDRLDPFMLDINEKITVLNVTYNDVHYKVMQNFLELGNIKEICVNTLSSQGFLKKFDDLEKQYDRLQMQHTQLKQQLFEQTVEFKNLQSDFDLAKKIADQNKTDNFRVKNMEQIVNEYRDEINKLKDKCQELKTNLFNKERECDRLNHTLKHGKSVVGAGIGISPTFDHSYAGPGGSIASGQINVSKVEISIQHQKLISELKVNQLKWRSNCENIIRLSNRFLTSMRLLQKIVHHSKNGQNDQQLKVQKMEFETHKKALEMILENVQKEINDSLKDVIVQGPQFGNLEQNVNFDSRTSENLNKIKNILDFQSQKQSYNFQDQKDLKQKSFNDQNFNVQQASNLNQNLQNKSQNENHQNNIQSPTIQHYKPQELIRMELETSQLKSEMETLKNFNFELEKKVEHLTKSLIETNQKQFLSEKENQRLNKMNEQILREKVEVEVKSSHQIKQLDEQISNLKNQSSIQVKGEDDLNGKNILKQFKSNNKKVQFKEDNDQDDFELNILKVRDGNREGRDLLKYSEMETFHVDKSMNSLAQSVKKKSYQGDPFKNPDPYVVKHEDAQDERNDINTKLINLLEEKEDVIMNLIVQKQKLKDIIDEMEKQQNKYLEQITSLNEEVLKWQNVELQHQELERLREDHSYQGEVIGKNVREIELLKSQIDRQDLILNEQYQSRITAQQDEYDKLQHQFTQERSEFIRQSKLTHDLEMNIIKQNDQLLALQKNHTDQLRIREDLEIQVQQLSQELKANQGDHDQVQFLQIKLKQFDKQIIENQDYIQVLQRDIVTFQERNKELTDRINVINYRQEEVVRERVQAYQDEILKITEQFNFEISQLKKDLLQKNDEILYHQKSLQLKDEYIKNELKKEIENVAQSRNDGQQQESDQVNSIQNQLQIANQTIQRIQGELMQERKLHSDQIKEKEQKWQIIENNLIDQLQIQGNELKKLQNQIQILKNQESPDELFISTKKEEIKNQEPQNANDIALEKLVIENNQLKMQLQKIKEQEDQFFQIKDPVLQEIPKSEENNIEYLKKELKIAQSQIYENNVAHLKQIKNLRQRLNMDENQLQQQLDQYIQNNQILEDQIENLTDEIKTLNEKHEDVLNENQNLLAESKKLNENNQLLTKQFQQNKQRLDDEIVGGAKLMSENQNLQNQAKQIEDQNSKLNQEINSLKNQMQQALNNENVFNKLIQDKNLENQNLKQKLEQLENEVALFKKGAKEDNEEMMNNFVDIKQKNMELQETIEDLEIEKQQLIQDFEVEKKQLILDLQVEQQQLKQNIIELQSEKRVLDQTKTTLEQRIQEMEQEREEAFWNQRENSEFNQSQKSSQRSVLKKIDDENLNKLNGFIKQLEDIQNEIKQRQEEVQTSIEKQFQYFPSIQEVKNAFTLQNFSQIKNFFENIGELLNNNDIKLMQKPIKIDNKRYLILQFQNQDDDDQINQQNGKLHIICESDLSQEQLHYILSFQPEVNREQILEDFKVSDAINQYKEQNLELKKQLDLLKQEYQVFLNDVQAQSEDIDDVEVLDLQYQKEENQHLKEQNYELKIRNQECLMANTELKKRIDEVNSILKQFFEVQNKDQVNNSIVSNKNEQQISANTNFLDILNKQQIDDDEFARGSSLKSENDQFFKSKVESIAQVKNSIFLNLKQIALQFDNQNLALLDVLFQNLSFSQSEIDEVIESIQQNNQNSESQIDFESLQVD